MTSDQGPSDRKTPRQKTLDSQNPEPQSGDPERVPSVSLVLPVGGRGEGFDRCLVSLARLDPLPYELTIVVDGQLRDLEEQASSFAAMINLRSGETIVRVVSQDRQRGPAAARNRGAAMSSGELLLFVDADVQVERDLVGRVSSLFAQRPELSGAIGSYDASPSAPQLVSQYRNLLHHWVHQQASESATTFWGACGVVRLEVFESVGGFDESFAVPSVEDIDLGARLSAAGHHLALVKDLQIKHLKRWTAREVIRTDLWRRAVPWTRLMLAQDGLINDLNVKWRDRLSVGIVGILIVALTLGLAWPTVWWLVPALGACLLFLNSSFYGFLIRHRGPFFFLGALPWHWVYLTICGLGYVVGWGQHVLSVASSKG